MVSSQKPSHRISAHVTQRANQIFGIGVDEDNHINAVAESLALADEFDEWPDEFLLLGVAQEDPEQGSSPESETSTTSETATTEDTDEDTDFDEDDAWPIEMLVG